jgi:hypothetical protein
MRFRQASDLRAKPRKNGAVNYACGLGGGADAFGHENVVKRSLF